ncbi:ABC transporter substrate-binding protein [Aestuariimicrobium soli]|uniref:ABC transporter substrate-binding protein n=1 Tax=Aestuariimicrobium soli TaxID=2035834 RepID=UPI003EB75593
MSKKLIGAAALLCAAALTASACSAPERKTNDPSTGASATSSTTASGSTGTGGEATGALTVLWNQYFYSLNSSTGFGNNVTNSLITYSTGSAAWYYDKDLAKVKDDSFATYEKTSDSPLTVKETLKDTATWSDGVPVQACDLILAYGANSTLFNTSEGESNPDTGKVDQKGGVYFDASSEAWKLVKDFPEIGDDGKSVTYKYSSVYGDWEYALFSNAAGIPAHIIGKKALGAADDQAGCDAVTKAFQDKDKTALAKIADMWNTAYNFTAMPTDKDLLVTNGPYVIKDMKDKQSLTMTANPEYKGNRKPKIKDITVVYNEDPTASAQALKNGEVAVIEPQATADLLKSLQGNDKIEVLQGETATYEHVDLQMKNGGPFDPAKYGGDAEKAKKVRQAFLLTIPRQQIVDTLIKPLNPEATTRDSFNVTPGTEAYDATVAGNGLAAAYGKVDIEKAKSLLTEAGASNVKVRLMYAKSNPRRQQEYALIAASAKQAGIEVINAGDDDWSNKLDQPNTYDASLFAWASNNDAVTGAAANFVPKGQNNYGNYDNASVGTMYAEMNKMTDKAKQDELNIKIEKQLVDDAFGTVLFQHPGIDAYDKTKVKNVSQMAFVPYYFWNIWEWELVG